MRREVNSIPRRIQFLSDALSFSLVPGGDSNLESIDSRPLWRRSSLSFGGFHFFHLSDWTITSRNNPAVSYQAQVFGEYRLIIPDDRDYRDRFKVAASILLESFSYNFVVITFAEGCLIVVRCFYLSCIKLDWINFLWTLDYYFRTHIVVSLEYRQFWDICKDSI